MLTIYSTLPIQVILDLKLKYSNINKFYVKLIMKFLLYKYFHELFPYKIIFNNY